MDIELAVDAMEIAPHIDQMVLFSGDGDFRSLVEAVATARRARDRRFDRLDATADGGRRASPPMRSVHRHRRTPSEDRPRSLRAADPRAEGAARSPRTAPHAAIPAAQSDRPARRSRRRIRRRIITMTRPSEMPGRDCPRCPRLAAFRKSLARTRAGMVQRAGAFIRAARCAAFDRRPRSGAARRQPHRGVRSPATMPAICFTRRFENSDLRAAIIRRGRPTA